MASSSLGPEFSASGSRFCVNAFHGYSHNYRCQVRNHPNSIVGIGIEDLETLERIFSSSNQLAPIIRYASPFRRHALIHLHFKQWDYEKYANISTMLYNNYRQALAIIAEGPSLQATLRDLNVTEADLRRYDTKEREYFTTLEDEDPKNLHAIVYVETLKELSKCR